MKQKVKVVIGLDISLNHTGFTALNIKTGEVCFYAYVTDKEKFVLRKQICVCFTKRLKFNTNNTETREVVRSRLVRQWILNTIKDISTRNMIITHAAIEGFSFASASRSVYQIGGLVEGIKSLLYSRRILMRTYSPKTIQSWAGVSNVKHKVDMIHSAIYNGFAALDTDCLLSVVKAKSGKDRVECPASDLADAYWLAHMLRTEILLRTGDMDLKKDLTDKRRKLLLNTTPKRKVNYLGYDFIGEFNA